MGIIRNTYLVGFYELTKDKGPDTNIISCRKIRYSNIEVPNLELDIFDGPETLECSWFKYNDCEIEFHPPLSMGDEVNVIKDRVTGEYYWTTTCNVLDSLGKENKRIYILNVADIDNVNEFTDTNSYRVKIDTVNKLVSLHTTDIDGELTSYDIKINTKEGILEVFDGRGNIIQLNSAEDKLTATTNNEVIINTKTMTINATDLNINSNVTIKGSTVSHNGKDIGDTHIDP